MIHAMPLQDDNERRARNLRTAFVLAMVAAAFLLAYVMRRILG